jgi:hypothetical protein
MGIVPEICALVVQPATKHVTANKRGSDNKFFTAIPLHKKRSAEGVINNQVHTPAFGDHFITMSFYARSAGVRLTLIRRLRSTSFL